MDVIQTIINGIAQAVLAVAIFTGCDAKAPDTTYCWITIPQESGEYLIIYSNEVEK
jgi:hypothetical protein